MTTIHRVANGLQPALFSRAMAEESDVLLGASVRFTSEGQSRTGTVAGFYRRDPPLVVVRLDDRTLEVPLDAVEIIVAPRFAPHLSESASGMNDVDRQQFAMLTILRSVCEQALDAFRLADNRLDDALIEDLERVAERTRLEIDAAVKATDAPASD